MLSVIYAKCRKIGLYAQYHYAECSGALLSSFFIRVVEDGRKIIKKTGLIQRKMDHNEASCTLSWSLYDKTFYGRNLRS